MTLPRDVRATIRQAMEMLPTWKRQERRDTVITARKNGLSVREAAAAAGCSVRHAKRILAAEGLYLGRLDKVEKAPPKPPPCYAQRHAAHLVAGQAECWPASPAPEPTVASPPQPEPSPIPLPESLDESRHRQTVGRRITLEDAERQRDEWVASLASGTRLDELARKEPDPPAPPQTDFCKPGMMVKVDLFNPPPGLSYLDQWALNLGTWAPAPQHPHDVRPITNFRPVDDDQWRRYRGGG